MLVHGGNQTNTGDNFRLGQVLYGKYNEDIQLGARGNIEDMKDEKGLAWGRLQGRVFWPVVQCHRHRNKLGSSNKRQMSLDLMSFCAPFAEKNHQKSCFSPISSSIFSKQIFIVSTEMTFI